MLAFHSRVWDKALLKGPLRSQVLLNTEDSSLGKVRENPEFTRDRKKKIWLGSGRIRGQRHETSALSPYRDPQLTPPPPPPAGVRGKP